MSAHYYPLINRLFSFNRVKDSLYEHLKELQGDGSGFTKPFITIDREPGSGGAPIAQAVATHLGFQFVDQQLIEEVARNIKKRKSIIQEIDEKGRSVIEDFVQSAINPEYVDDMKYMKELARVVLAYALKGHVVILGRGASALTPFGKGLHVNIIAPYDVRVHRAINFEGHSLKDAKKVIAKVEDERSSFIKQYFKKSPDDADTYDLVINTRNFSINDARDVIVEAFYRKFSRTVRYGSLWK